MKRTFVSIFLLLTGFGLSSHAQTPAACDRACLSQFITQYLDSLVSHKPGALPVADSVRFTEDTKEMKLGEGLWKTASRITPYRQEILDVRQGVAGVHSVVEENGMPVML